MKRAALGIQLGATGSVRDTLGIFVTHVTPKGPAETAGIIEGDRIASINGVDLRLSAADAGDSYAAGLPARRLTREVRKLAPGGVASLRVYSGGRIRHVRVTAGRASDLLGEGRGFGFELGEPGNSYIFRNGGPMGTSRIDLERDLPMFHMEGMPKIRMENVPRFRMEGLPKMRMEGLQKMRMEGLPKIRLEDVPRMRMERLQRIQLRDGSRMRIFSPSRIRSPGRVLLAPGDKRILDAEGDVLIDADGDVLIDEDGEAFELDPDATITDVYCLNACSKLR